MSNSCNSWKLDCSLSSCLVKFKLCRAMKVLDKILHNVLFFTFFPNHTNWTILMTLITFEGHRYIRKVQLHILSLLPSCNFPFWIKEIIIIKLCFPILNVSHRSVCLSCCVTVLGAFPCLLYFFFSSVWIDLAWSCNAVLCVSRGLHSSALMGFNVQTLECCVNFCLC